MKSGGKKVKKSSYRVIKDLQDWHEFPYSFDPTAMLTESSIAYVIQTAW